MTEMKTQPRYLEAYPRINIVTALSEIQKGRVVCEFTDNRHRIIGLVRKHSMTQHELILEYDVALPFLQHSIGRIVCELHDAPLNNHPERKVMICPSCAKRKCVIVYVGEWSCSTCHGLLHRSQKTGGLTQKWEKMEFLKTKVGYGRKKGMHRSTYTRLRQEYLDLRKSFRGSVNYDAREELFFVTSSKWTRPRPEQGLFFIGP